MTDAQRLAEHHHEIFAEIAHRFGGGYTPWCLLSHAEQAHRTAVMSRLIETGIVDPAALSGEEPMEVPQPEVVMTTGVVVGDPEDEAFADLQRRQQLALAPPRIKGESEDAYNARKGRLEAERLDARKRSEADQDRDTALARATAVWDG